MSNITHTTFALVASVFFAIIAAVILTGDRIGLDFVLWSFSCLGSVILYKLYMKITISRPTVLNMLCGCIFILCLIWRESKVLYILNFMALITISVLAYGKKLSGKLCGLSILAWTKVYFKFIGEVISGPFYLFGYSILPSYFRRGLTEKSRAIIFGFLLSVPVILVIGLLFVSSDLRFEGFVDYFFEIDFFSIFNFSIEILLYLPVTSILFMLMLTEKMTGDSVRLYSKAEGFRTHEFTMSTMLFSLILLFLIYIFIQSTYFWGGDKLIVEGENGLTYSDYARKGFWELIWATMISLCIIVFSNWSVDSNSNRRLIKRLSWFAMVLLLLLELSAGHRIYLYIKAYGLTELRFYSSVFMLFIACVIVLVYFYINAKKLKGFSHKIAYVFLVFVIALNVINPNALIASYNVKSDPEQVDVEYLIELGLDAYPAWLFDQKSLSPQGVCTAISLMNKTAKRPWHEWNYAAYKAKRLYDLYSETCKDI